MSTETFTEDFEWKLISIGSVPMRNEDSCMVENNGKLYIFGGSRYAMEPPYFFNLFEYCIGMAISQASQNNLSLKNRFKSLERAKKLLQIRFTPNIK